MDIAARRQLSEQLGALAGGDRAAFDPVYRALWPVLRAFAKRMLASAPEADAEDAAQHALLKVFARASDYDPSRDGLTWALAIAAYECRTRRRQLVRRREDGDGALEALVDRGATPESLAIDRDLAAALEEAVGTLSDRDRETIEAALLGARPVAGATFRKRLERALVRLRSAWETTHGRD